MVECAGTDTTAILDGFTISYGNAQADDQSGGGVYCWGSPTLRNLVISHNRATHQGGGMYIYSGSPTLTNVSFIGNSAFYGGGIAIDALGGPSAPVIANAVFRGNEATSAGGGLCASRGNTSLKNATFYGNNAPMGGAVFSLQGSATLENSILWGNSPDQVSVPWGTSPVSISYSILQPQPLQDIPTGVGCLSDDPLFVDADAGDLHLRSTSPAIDAGSSELVSSDTDLDGNTRIQGLAVDMGAYETAAAGTAPTITLQPQNQTVAEGETATFTAAATGSPAPAVQWEVSNDGTNWVPIADATQETLSFPAQMADDGNQYRAVFTNSVDSATTSAASLTVTPAGPATIYVDDSAEGLGTGADWANAYTDLQLALSAAASGDQIWVADGTYKPTTGADRTATFSLKDAVSLYGGFAGTEAALSERNWRANVSLLSGDIGTAGAAGDNSYHVVSIGDAIATGTVLDGFYITGGNANNLDSGDDKGGGIYSSRLDGDPAALTLVNLILFDNSANEGGGAYIYRETPHNDSHTDEMTDCAFIGNQASNIIGAGWQPADGGALWTRSRLVLSNVVVSGNRVGPLTDMNNHASAIFATLGTLTLNNVTVSGNHVVASATESGGVIYSDLTTVRLNNTIVWGNTRTDGVDTPIVAPYGPPEVHYSDVQGGTFAGSDGNIEADPLFVSPVSAVDGPTPSGDLRLGAGYET